VSDGKTPGIAVGIMQDGKVVLEKGYGMANLEHKVPAKCLPHCVDDEAVHRNGNLAVGPGRPPLHK
jgi:hypothetical protein